MKVTCYTWPYKSDNTKVEVRVVKRIPTSFARIFGIMNVTVSARAVASISPGAPPPYSFVALNQSGDKHTLLVKLGGDLTVNKPIYVNSSNIDSAPVPPGEGDAFDIFGGGNISAPDIRSSEAGRSRRRHGHRRQPPVLAHLQRRPLLPGESLAAAMNATQTTLTPSGTAIQVGDVVQIGSERMLVTPAAAVSLRSPMPVLTGGVATLTAGNSADLSAGDTVTVSGVGARFDGIYAVRSDRYDLQLHPHPARSPDRDEQGGDRGRRVLTTSTPAWLARDDDVTVAPVRPTSASTARSRSCRRHPTTFSYTTPSDARRNWVRGEQRATLRQPRPLPFVLATTCQRVQLSARRSSTAHHASGA